MSSLEIKETREWQHKDRTRNIHIYIHTAVLVFFKYYQKTAINPVYMRSRGNQWHNISSDKKSPKEVMQAFKRTFFV
jgi:hypothetical protein